MTKTKSDHATGYDLILFDVDDTLIDFRAGQRGALASVLASLSATFSEHALARFSAINGELWVRHERGEVTKADIFRLRFERLFAELGIDGHVGEANERFLDGLVEHSVLFDGAAEVVLGLASTHVLGVVSNGDGRVQRQRLERIGLGSIFRAVIISDEVGHAKPHPSIFAAAMRAAAVAEGARVQMVGDNLTADVVGALGAGFDACWLAPPGSVAPDHVRPTYVVHSIKDVLKLPGISLPRY